MSGAPRPAFQGGMGPLDGVPRHGTVTGGDDGRTVINCYKNYNGYELAGSGSAVPVTGP